MSTPFTAAFLGGADDDGAGAAASPASRVFGGLKVLGLDWSVAVTAVILIIALILAGHKQNSAATVAAVAGGVSLLLTVLMWKVPVLAGLSGLGIAVALGATVVHAVVA